MRNKCLFHLASQVGKYEYTTDTNLHNMLCCFRKAPEYAFFQIVITMYTQRQCFWDPINHYHSNNLYCLFSSSVNLMSEKSYFSVSLMTFTQILMKLNIFHIYRPFILPLCKIPCSFCLPIFLSGVYFLFTNYYSLYTLKLVVNCVPKSSSLPEAWGTECMFSLSSTNVKFIILI